jgi:hypothetical protein
MIDLMQLSRNRWPEILGRLGIDQSICLMVGTLPAQCAAERIDSDSPITMATANMSAISAAMAAAGI